MGVVNIDNMRTNVGQNDQLVSLTLIPLSCQLQNTLTLTMTVITP